MDPKLVPGAQRTIDDTQMGGKVNDRGVRGRDGNRKMIFKGTRET